jgi:chromosome segregation ATPase
MTQGFESTESLEVRRAFDRLQQTLEELGDRYRELRRERRQLHAYLDELEHERDKSGRDVAQRLEAAATDRKRVGELEELLAAAREERERAEGIVAELEAQRAQALSEVATLRSQMQESELHGERFDAQQSRVEELQRELGRLRQVAAIREEDAQHAQQEAAAARAQLAELTDRFEALKVEHESLRAAQVPGGGNGDGVIILSENERSEMVGQINDAIRLIDKYLKSA